MAQRPDLTNIKVEVSDPQFLSFMREIFENVRDYNNVREAKAISEKLVALLEQDSELAASNPDLYRQYGELCLMYKFVALPNLPIEEAETLIAQNLLVGLNIQDFDLRHALDAFLQTFSNDLDMFQFLDRLERVLEKSEIKIGSAQLDATGGPQKPSLANWISEYLQSNVGRPERGSLEEISFVTNNRNVQKLSKEDREILKKVLEFYDWLKFPKDVEDTEFVSPEVERAFSYVAENADRIVDEILAEEQGAKKGEISSLGSVMASALSAPAAPRASMRREHILPPPPRPPTATSIVSQTYTVPPAFTAPPAYTKVATAPLPPSSGVSAGKPIPEPVFMPEIKIVEPEPPKNVEPQKTAPAPTTMFRLPSTPSQPKPQPPRITQEPRNIRTEELPKQRPDLIKPVISGQQAGGAARPSITYRLPPTTPAAPHPSAADRSQINVAPKFVGEAKGPMVRPQAVVGRQETVGSGQQQKSPVTPSTSSTLEELRKIHAEEEKRRQSLDKTRDRQSGSAPSIMPLGASDFSVNEALIHAGKTKPGGGTGLAAKGGMVAEGEPADVEEKLKKLEGNFTDKPKEPGAP